MNAFSFSSTAGASQSSVQIKLVGNEIHNVKFKGCEIKDVVGVKDPTLTYNQLIIKFANEDGIYEHTCWEPKPEDFKRIPKEITLKSGEKTTIDQPSRVEDLMLFFKHLIDAVNPKLAAAINDGSKADALNSKGNNVHEHWLYLRNLLVKVTDDCKDVETSIKLLKNKDGEAIFPSYFTGLSKEGKVYIKDNFIGKKLAFTTYQAQRINNEASATPTRIAVTENSFGLGSESAPKASNLDMDFDLSDLGSL